MHRTIAGGFHFPMLSLHHERTVNDLTHFNKSGEAHMVDVGDKAITHRIAVARGRIGMRTETLELIEKGNHKKGDVLGIARIAGIMGAKRTSDLIPLCHPLNLTRVEVDLTTDHAEPAVWCRATAEVHSKTGVEMEALCAVQVALLTIYDMCKAVDRGMVIDQVCLVQKQGGRSGDWQRSTD